MSAKPKSASSSKSGKRSASPVNVDDGEPAKKPNAGRAAFMAMLQNKPARPATVKRSGNGAVPMMSVQGVIVSTKISSVPGRAEGQMMPKLDFLLVSNSVNANNAPDCVDTSIPGCAYLLPTQKGVAPPTPNASDDGPEAALANKGGKAKDGKDKKAPTPPRTLVLSEGHKTVSTFCIRSSVFIHNGNNNGEDDKDKDNNKPKMNVDAIQPGMVVNVTGIVASVGADGKTLWLNARDVTPLRPPIQPGDETKTLINEFMSKELAFSSALFASPSMNGFFGMDFDGDEAQAEQAKVYHCMWTAFVQQTSKSCENLANTLSASMDEKQSVEVLNAHASRIATSVLPADVASASSFLFLPSQPPTQDKPLYCAPLVQRGKTADLAVPSDIMAIVEQDEEAAKSLPRTFASLDVQFVEIKGAAIRLQCGLWFVGDKETALVQLKNGKNPILSSGTNPALGISLSMRTFCATLGVIVKSKAEMVAKQLLLYADMAVVAEVNPKDPNSGELNCCFPKAIMVDMAASIPKIGVRVSEAWVQKNLCGGATQYVHEDDDSVEKVTERDNRTPVVMKDPALRGGYQAISECSFKFGLSKTPVDKPIKNYYVVYAASSEAHADGPPSIEEGEKLIESAASDKNISAYEFLTGEAVVYCVASAE